MCTAVLHQHWDPTDELCSTTASVLTVSHSAACTDSHVPGAFKDDKATTMMNVAVMNGRALSSSTGSSYAPQFNQQIGDANPFDAVDVGSNNVPYFVDANGDGKIDCFMGSSNGKIYYFKNVGTVSVAVFEPQLGINNPFDGQDWGTYVVPAFADLDGDGDVDAIIGEKLGTLEYWENTRSPTNPVFTSASDANLLRANGALIVCLCCSNRGNIT